MLKGEKGDTGDSDFQPAVDALGKRIDNLILSSGTDSSAEVIDARTGYDGTAYDTLGTAIRAQIKNTRPDHIDYYIDTSLEGFNTDANTYTKNGIYWIYLLKGLTNLHFPNIKSTGTFKVFAYDDTYVQQIIETTNGSYVRFCINGNWREWRDIENAPHDHIPLINTNTPDFNTDANTYTKNGIYWINLLKGLTNLHYPDIPYGSDTGTFKIFSYSDDYVVQTLGLKSSTYIRHCVNGNWIEWRDIANTSEMNDARVGIDGTKYSDLGTAIRTQIKNSRGGIKPYATGLAQFKKFGVIGDSLSVGHFSNTSTRNLWYSWPQSVARMHGNTAINFGKSGDSVLTWWHESAETGKDLLGASGNKCQAYVIALGVNDTGWRNVPLGSFNDIDLNNYNNNKETWYGGYARIIQYINSINPNAIIFCLTNVWTNSEKSHQFDDAIKEILANETLGKQCLLVDMVANYAVEFNAFKNKYAMNGHNNANGYAIGGRIIDMAIGETFADSKFETVDIGLIPCDE